MAGMIPQRFIDDLLGRADIVDVVEKRVRLRKGGKNYQGLCPFHQEKSPSFSVEPDKQFYYCFGCGAGGNALGFIMNYENVDFPEAVEILAAEYGLEVPRQAATQAEKQRQSENDQLLELLEKASTYYQAQLRSHETRQQAVDYLKARGLSGTVARDFQLGYAPPGWDNLLTCLGTSDQARQLMMKAGLLIEKSRTEPATDGGDTPRYYDRFRHRIMFPIRDNRGRVVGFGGRVLGNDKPKYLNSPETPVFHKSHELYGLFDARRANKSLGQVLVVEGYMDVIALAQAGISNAVATLGTACNAGHLARLFRLTKKVIFCFDGDDAGRAAAWRALEVCIPLMEDGRDIGFLFLPDGEDPDSLVRKTGKEKFLDLLHAARPLADFFFEKLGRGLDLAEIGDRARLAQLAAPLIKQFPKGVYGQLMKKRLAETIGVDPDELDQAAPSHAADDDLPPEHVRQWQGDRNGRGSRSPARRAKPLSFGKPWSLKAIELILARPSIALAVERDFTPLRDLDGINSAMLLKLIELVRSNPNITTYSLLGHFYDSPVGNQLTQLARGEQITPAEGIEEEFMQIIDSILSDVERQSEIQKAVQELRRKLDR